VLLIMRHPSVSLSVLVLLFTYPVTEVVYSIRRRRRARLPADAPDNLHLHSLIKTQVVLRHVPHWNPRLRNAAVSPLVWIYAAVPAGLAVLLQDAPVWATLLALVGCVLWYHRSYKYLAARQSREPLPDSGLASLEPIPKADR
jgi:UDP-N-acetylmuramyl pentapeptide phosphotransferase/UDP-N-acetylglucosamine-1-phosphate transferase